MQVNYRINEKWLAGGLTASSKERNTVKLFVDTFQVSKKKASAL